MEELKIIGKSGKVWTYTINKKLTVEEKEEALKFLTKVVKNFEKKLCNEGTNNTTKE